VKTVAFLTLILPLTGFGIAQASPPNWTGKYAPCDRHADLLNRENVDLAVRISTSNTALAQQFARAMDFWTEVLDLEWHEVESEDCSMQLVDGTPSLFDWCTCMSARSQFPDRPDFEGWIAFNPRLKLTKQEMFLDSVHEIGHLLGLPHNPSELSVMYAFELDKAASLDAVDLDALAARHKLRSDLVNKGGNENVKVIVQRQTASRGGWWSRPFSSGHSTMGFVPASADRHHSFAE
jgi:hypothetical protein